MKNMRVPVTEAETIRRQWRRGPQAEVELSLWTITEASAGDSSLFSAVCQESIPGLETRSRSEVWVDTIGGSANALVLASGFHGGLKEQGSSALLSGEVSLFDWRPDPADYVNLNRLDEAEATYKEAERRKLSIEGWAKSRYLLAFLKGDEAQMAQLASSVTGKRGDEDVMLAAQADTEAWYGRLKNSRELTRRARFSRAQ